MLGPHAAESRGAPACVSDVLDSPSHLLGSQDARDEEHPAHDGSDVQGLASVDDPAAVDPRSRQGQEVLIRELLRSVPLQDGAFTLWHWRDSRGREIDIVAECGRRLACIEVKASSAVSREDLRHLDWFALQGPGKGRTVTSILLYLGTEPLVLGERAFALPVSILWARWARTAGATARAASRSPSPGG